MKELFIINRVTSSSGSSEGVISDGTHFDSVRIDKPSYTDNKEFQQLQELLKQRDDEISNMTFLFFVSMLNCGCSLFRYLGEDAETREKQGCCS